MNSSVVGSSWPGTKTNNAQNKQTARGFIISLELEDI
jgi:hypothetical protein